MRLSSRVVLTFLLEGSLLALVFFLPTLFVPWTLDALEVNKQSLLLILTSVAALAWCARAFEERSVTFRSGRFLFLPVVFFALVLVSALFSRAPYQSFVGSQLQEYQSVLTLGALTVLFWILAAEAHNMAFRRRLFFATLLSAVFVFGCALLHTFGFTLAGGLGNTFNPVGTLNALGLYGVVLSVFGLALWLASRRQDHDVFFVGIFGIIEKVLILFISTATLFYLLALDFWVLWVLLLVGVGLLFMVGLVRAEEFPHTRRFLLPIFMGVLSIFFLFLPRPFSLGLPVEVTPTWKLSTSVGRQVLADRAWSFGSGPGTYAYDYARFRPLDVNQTSFWDVRFDRAHDYALTLLPTLGIVPFAVLLVWLLALAVATVRGLLRDRAHALWHTRMAISVPWFVLFVALFLYSSNMTLLFLFYLLTALLSSFVLKEKSFTLARSPRAGLALSFAGVLLAIGFLTLVFTVGGRVLSEKAFAKALRADRAGESVEDVLRPLVHAATRNRYDDAVYRNLAEVLLERARLMLEGKNVSDFASPELTALQQTISGSVNAAKRATDINPYNVLNWRTRGLVYREAMPLLSDAEGFARLSFERAVALEPQSPVNVVGLGRVYLVQASMLNRLLSAAGDEGKAAAQKREKALASAEEQFTKAVALKNDYAPAHFYLALLYQEAGRLEEAAKKLDALLRYNSLDVGVVFQRGVLAIRMGDNKKAEEMFTRAVDLAPNFANARWFLASVYEEQGDFGKAIEQMEAISATSPDLPIVSARLERLKAGKAAAEAPAPIEEVAE